MKITEIVEMQKVLDNRIFDKFGLKAIDTLDDRKLALVVELAELANEVRCFKFWSVKKRSEQEIILEEYVDCLHFVISIGITLDVDFSTLSFDCETQLSSITNQFLKVMSLTNTLSVDNKEVFYELYKELMVLAYNLGFSDNEIMDAYKKKNELNHTRQTNNY